MTHRHTLNALLIAAALVPTAAFADVDTFPVDADLTGYETYTWHREAADLEPMELRIREMVDREMAAKGFEKVEEGADLEARLKAGAWTETRIDTHTPMTLRPRVDRWMLLHGFETVEIREIEKGRFEVALIDTEADTVVWEAVAEGMPRKKMEKNVAKIEKATARMFETFEGPLPATE